MNTIHIMQAENEQCLDVDKFGEWIGGKLYTAPKVRQVATHCAHLPDLFTPELVALLLECGPGQLLAVRDELRARYLATRSDEINARADEIEAACNGEEAALERYDLNKDRALEAA